MGKNTLKLEMSGFKEIITRLDKLGGDINSVVADALTQAGETIGEDTLEALNKSNLPAKGKYSNSDTKASVITKPIVEWQGTQASIGVGFDYSKPGAGGFLITGTPRMKPVYRLQDIYKRKKYMKFIQEGLQDVAMNAIDECMGGG